MESYKKAFIIRYNDLDGYAVAKTSLDDPRADIVTTSDTLYSVNGKLYSTFGEAKVKCQATDTILEWEWDESIQKMVRTPNAYTTECF